MCVSGILNCEPFLTSSGLFVVLAFFVCMCNGCCMFVMLCGNNLDSWEDVTSNALAEFDCEQHGEDDSPVVRFFKALAKPVGAITAIIFQIQAINEITAASKLLEDARISSNLATFDNCCSRVTGLEETAYFCFTFNCGTIITYVCYFVYTRFDLYDPFRNQPYGGHGKVVAIIVKQARIYLLHPDLLSPD